MSTIPRAKRLAYIRAQMTAGAAQDRRTPVALILGAGAGIGQAVAQKFAKEGYHTVVVRRGAGPNRLLTDADKSKQVLEAFCDTIRAEGGQATAIFANGTVPEEVAAVIKRCEEEIGPVDFINYNIGAQVGDRKIEKTSYRIFELAWRMGSLGAFAVAKEASPYMIKRGRGTILYTSSTAAYRGNPGQHAHTAAMGGRIRLTQSLAAELGPQGIHIAHVNVDGMVDAPETVGRLLGRMDPDGWEKMRQKRLANREILEPHAIADTYFHIHKQPKSVWTLDLDMRPWTTKAWFN